MGDSSCLMHSFSYASALPNRSKMQAVLGESISFGRFVNESEPLSWEKWSTFPRKKYVEEAARYAQPGSVAQKKAFFEAHYKKIAAQKAAAAALLEQENSARAEAERALVNAAAADDDDDDNQVIILNSSVELCSDLDHEIGDSESSLVGVIAGHEGSEQRISVSLSENLGTASCSEGTTTPQMEKPLLKGSCVGSEDISSATSKKKSDLSSLKSSIRRKTWKVTSSPTKQVTPHLKKESNLSQSGKKSSLESMDKKRPFPKSLRGLINLIPIKETDKATVSVAKNATRSELTPSLSTTLKDCKTPLRTPILAAAKGVAKYSAQTPLPENRRYSRSSTASQNKLQSPASSTPFVLKTEERAAKRKQKLEEKFKSSEEQKMQLQKTFKEKAGHEFEKLSRSLCFKARPLPEFYKERETPINQTNKTPAARPQTVVLGRSNSKNGASLKTNANIQHCTQHSHDALSHNIKL